MPFREYSGFDLETMRLMTRAYDDAVAKLAMENTNPSTSKLAALIVSMVRAGERDPEKLCERALAELRK